MKRRPRKFISRPVYEHELPNLWDEMRKKVFGFNHTPAINSMLVNMD